MFFSADKHSAKCNRGDRMTEFIKRVTMQDVERVTGLNHNDLTGSRNAIQSSINPDRRAEEIPADAFLVSDAAGFRVETSHNPAVAPKPRAFAGSHAGYDVRRRT